MQDSEFNDWVDSIFEQLEDELTALSESECDDMDIDASAGLLSVSFGKGSVIILSRQIANHEIWVAAKSGGFHLALGADRKQWYCNATGESLATLIGRVFSEQIGQPVTLLAD